jgi:hypothetical protein
MATGAVGPRISTSCAVANRAARRSSSSASAVACASKAAAPDPINARGTPTTTSQSRQLKLASRLKSPGDLGTVPADASDVLAVSEGVLTDSVVWAKTLPQDEGVRGPVNGRDYSARLSKAFSP